MKNVILICRALLALMHAVAGRRANRQRPAEDRRNRSTKDVDHRPRRSSTENRRGAAGNPRFVRTLTNVQIELTLTDQIGTAPPEKKTVSMIVSSGNWGKIRSAGNVRPVGDAPFVVDLNVDARPFVSIEGPIQLELTLNYYPPRRGDRQG